MGLGRRKEEVYKWNAGVWGGDGKRWWSLLVVKLLGAGGVDVDGAARWSATTVLRARQAVGAAQRRTKDNEGASAVLPRVGRCVAGC
jgi:hypothetical protein